MSPTRASELVSCYGLRPATHPHARSRWSTAAPRIRDSVLRPSGPRWPVHEFAESDYCYGIGPIRMRLVRVDWHQPIPHEGDVWLGVRGIVIDRFGGEGPVRELLIRAGRVPVPPACRRPRMRVSRSTPV
ncbi:hypothetical protein [Actinoplanes sp. NPDC051851]|uniref:hypothetical protein n=1 Tax=Actinoplanes sp. NPDC051851 TaxID=3154753 RepID=UPI0034164021